MIGDIQGIEVGSIFESRRALHDAGVHRGLQKGIGAQGEAIVLSGGYVDDVDEGDTIIYTGEGGRDLNTGRQIADQTLTRGNLALARNYREGNPIRVSRGHTLDSPYAPETGLRYDGLYRIEHSWRETGIDGFIVWRYRLVRISEAEQIPSESRDPVPTGEDQPGRSTVYTTRVIRNSAVGNHVKDLYNYTCQISGVQLQTPSGAYAEACHIRPVGRPHNGPDVVGNVLCLSPNMHVLFDMGAITLSDDLQVIGIDAQISVQAEHNLSVECIRYHRQHIYNSG
ncbi:YDG/SRA domain-containing protein [Thermodesulfobacteriota bacterium]